MEEILIEYDSPKIISDNYRKTKNGVIKNYSSLFNLGKIYQNQKQFIQML